MRRSRGEFKIGVKIGVIEVEIKIADKNKFI
jgi:hypothetical protein